MKTNPWISTDRTITQADHVSIPVNEILLLVEYQETEDVEFFIWLWDGKVVWQILKKKLFFIYWETLSDPNLS